MKNNDDYDVDKIVDEIISSRNKKTSGYDDSDFKDDDMSDIIYTGGASENSHNFASDNSDDEEYDDGDAESYDEDESDDEEWDEGQQKKRKDKAGNKSLKNKKGFLVIFAVAATLLVFCIAFFAVKYSNEGSGNSSGVTGQLSAEGVSAAEVSQPVQTNFPYTLYGETIEAMEPLGGKLLVLSDVSATIISTNGQLVTSVQHSYSKPAIKSSGNRAIIYDKTTAQYKVLDASGEMFNELISGRRIFTGAISKCGRYAVVTDDDEAACVLTVYSADGSKHLFEWKCPTERIVCVGMSDNGQNIAAGVITAENGQLVSKVYLLSLDMVETPKPYVCESGALVDLRYISKNKVSVITDKARTIVAQDGTVSGSSVSFGTTAINSFGCDDDGLSAVVVDSFGEFDESLLYICNRENNQTSPAIESSALITGVYCDNGKIYIISGSTLIRYNSDGTETGRVSVSDTFGGLTSVKGRLYCFADGTIFKFSF